MILSFTDGKQLILNKTNARSIARILGTDETHTWDGHDIMLVPAQVDFKGDIVDAIRVKPAPVRKTAAMISRRSTTSPKIPSDNSGPSRLQTMQATFPAFLEFAPCHRPNRHKHSMAILPIRHRH